MAHRLLVLLLAAVVHCAAASAGHTPDSRGHAQPWRAQLKRAVEKAALDNEVLVCVADAGTPLPALRLWINATHRHVPNSLLVALDDQTANIARDFSFPTVRLRHSSNSRAATKFAVIKEILELGCSTFVTDAYTITLKNPFTKLARDSDVEALSDGVDQPSSEGITEMMHGPDSKSAHLVFHMQLLNSGLFYARASERTVRFMDRMVERLSSSHASEQVVFHELAIRPSSTDYRSAQVTVRVLDTSEYVNVKALLRALRQSSDVEPTAIHVTHLADKLDAMLVLWARFVDNDPRALDHLAGHGPGLMQHDLAPILRVIDAAGLGELRNPVFVRSMVERAGLFYDARRLYGSDNRFMRPQPGGGLWQCPIQMATMLVYLSNLGIRTMLEIGTATGWTTTIISAYLRRFGLEVCQTVDLASVDLLDRELPNVWRTHDVAITLALIDGNGTITPALLPSYDLVFIDGDHSYPGVSGDYKRYGPLARRAIMFHDVADSFCHDVRRFWSEVRQLNAWNTTIHEFTLRGAPEDAKEPPLMGFGVLELVW